MRSLVEKYGLWVWFCCFRFNLFAMTYETSDFSEGTGLNALDENLWTLRYPMRFLGMALGRRVCVMRLSDGRVVVHSSGPFVTDDVEAIGELGRVDLLLEATTMHDTFSREGRAAFPGARYLVPEGFPKGKAGLEAGSVAEVDCLTGGEVCAVRLEGMRFLNEYACFHAASRTLMLGDLLFNLTGAKGWTRWSMRWLMGVKQWPAIDRPVRMAVADRDAFAASMRRILDWDFDRVVVAHGAIIERDGKRVFREALERAEG